MSNKQKNISFFSLLLILLLSMTTGGLAGFFASEFRLQIFDTIPFIESRVTAPSVQNVQKETVIVKEQIVYVEESSIIDAAKEVSPAVVSIVITKDLPLYRNSPYFFDFDEFFSDPFADPFFNMPNLRRSPETDEKGNPITEKRKIGGGTGFIFDESGLVLTNRHVVSDSDAEFTIILSDGAELEAEVLDKDTHNDIAVLQIKKEELEEGKDIKYPTVTLGDSSNVKIGQKVIAVGNALSQFENTVTVGVISATGRKITASDFTGRNAEMLSGLIQTDAAINPGNSGGPLVNLMGQVIGINTAIATGANGIGFAIPINDAKNVIESIKEHGKIVRPFLGVRYMILNEARAKNLALPIKHGALLVGDDSKGEFAVIPGSPAEKANLQMKDVILEVDGIEINEENDLSNLIIKKNVGDEVKMKVWRSGEEVEINVKLEEQP